MSRVDLSTVGIGRRPFRQHRQWWTPGVLGDDEFTVVAADGQRRWHQQHQLTARAGAAPGNRFAASARVGVGVGVGRARRQRGPRLFREGLAVPSSRMTPMVFPEGSRHAGHEASIASVPGRSSRRERKSLIHVGRRRVRRSRSAILAVVVMMASVVSFVAFSPVASADQTPGQLAQFDVRNTLSNLTTGGPYTFLQSAPTFQQFDPSLGTLTGTTLTWNIGGSENGTGNFAGTGTFSYAGQTQVVTFDTVSDPGPKPFNFNGSVSYTGPVTGLGTFAPSTFTGIIEQSGYFPWSGSMSAVGFVSIRYQYTPAGTDTTSPSLTDVPADVSLEATSPQGATVTYTAPTATDAVGVVSQGCSPASGATFPLGATTVKCTATDAANNVGNASFTVTVLDSTAPALSNVPVNVSVEATSLSGAAVTYTAPTASDAVGVVSQGCTPASGSVFPMGPTTVRCTAADAAHNVGNASFTVTVADTTAPTLSTVPSSLRVEATSANGATVTYTPPTASDAVGVVSQGCRPASGSVFPMGPTTVQCTAADAAHNIGNASFTVTVADTTAPVYKVATNIAVDASSPSGATVTYAVPTATDAVGVVSNACAPQSSSKFAIGSTTVTCNASDTAGNISSAIFTVTVRSATQQVTSLQTQVAGLTLSSTLGNSLKAKLATVQNALASGNKATACTALSDFISQVKGQSGKAIPKADADALTTTATRIKTVNGC